MISYLLATFLFNPDFKLVQKEQQNYGLEQSQGFAMQIRSESSTYLLDYRFSEQTSTSGSLSIRMKNREYSIWQNRFFYEGYFLGFGLGSTTKNSTTQIGQFQEFDQGKNQLFFGPRIGLEKQFLLPQEMKLLFVVDARVLFGQELYPNAQPGVGIRVGLAY